MFEKSKHIQQFCEDFHTFCQNFHIFCPDFKELCLDFRHIKTFGDGLVPPPPTPVMWWSPKKRMAFKQDLNPKKSESRNLNPSFSRSMYLVSGVKTDTVRIYVESSAVTRHCETCILVTPKFLFSVNLIYFSVNRAKFVFRNYCCVASK